MVWRDSSNSPNKDEKIGGRSIRLVEDYRVIYDSLFAFLANIEGEKEKEVTLLDTKDNLDYYYTKRLKSLTSMWIDFA